MAEYIERETAVRAVMAAKWVDGSDGAMAMEIVASPAAADVAPVVHGRWMERRNGGTLCSRCGSYTQHKGDVLDMSKAIACPWCGAKMDGGADHEAD